MILDKINLFGKIGASVLDLWLDMSLGTSSLNVVSRHQTPRSKSLLRFHNYWIHLIILEKMRSCLRKLKLGFWISYISRLDTFLGPSSPTVISRSQFYSRFHNFVRFIL